MPNITGLHNPQDVILADRSSSSTVSEVQVFELRQKCEQFETERRDLKLKVGQLQREVSSLTGEVEQLKERLDNLRHLEDTNNSIDIKRYQTMLDGVAL